jgi:hypothetical protein
VRIDLTLDLFRFPVPLKATVVVDSIMLAFHPKIIKTGYSSRLDNSRAINLLANDF